MIVVWFSARVSVRVSVSVVRLLSGLGIVLVLALGLLLGCCWDFR